MADEDEYGPWDGRPNVLAAPLDKLHPNRHPPPCDRLLTQLRAVHGTPRYDVAKELLRRE